MVLKLYEYISLGNKFRGLKQSIFFIWNTFDFALFILKSTYLTLSYDTYFSISKKNKVIKYQIVKKNLWKGKMEIYKSLQYIYISLKLCKLVLVIAYI